MDGPRALMSGDGGPSFGGRPSDGLEIGALAAPPTEPRSKFSSWIGKLAEPRARRGSIGFNADGGIDLNTDIARMDDDSNSGLDSVRGVVAQYRDDDGGGGGAGSAIPFRRREPSFSNLQTPGGDGDTFTFNYKRRTSIEYSEAPLVSIKEGLVLKEPEPVKPTAALPPSSILQTLHEGKPLKTPASEDMEVDIYQPDVPTASHYGPGTEVRGRTEDAASIFLIDLETTKDGAIKPTTKKFAVSKLLQGKLLQSWFFRNDGHEEEDRDGAVHKDKDGEQSRRPSRDKSGSEEPEPLSFLGKFKAAVENHPKPLREMNTWQPQGH